MKKVLFVTTTLNAGGVENYLLRFLNFYNGDIKPVIVCKGGETGDLEMDFLAINNIKIIPLKLGYVDVYGHLKLYQLLKNQNIQTVCDFTGNFAGLVLMAAKFAGVKRRIAFYRGATNHFNENWYKLFYNWLMNLLVIKYSTKILSNSKAAIKFFFSSKSLLGKEIRIIYNGLDHKKFNNSNLCRNLKKVFGIPENAFVVGHVGRFNKAKNHELIFEVAKKLTQKYENIYFVLVGKYTNAAIVELIRADSTLSDRVILTGYRKDVDQILKIFDVFIFPSITEGQPNALIEAMVSGLPIVASDIEPIREATPEKFHKYLADPTDIEKFTMLLSELYSDHDIRENFILDDWARDNFDHSKRFNEFYEEL